MNINLCVISWSDQTTNHCFEEFLENNWQLSSISWDFLKMIEIFYSWSLLNFRWLRYSKMSSAWSLLIISTFRSKSRLSFEKIEKIVLFWLIIRLALISEISKKQQRVWKVIHNDACDLSKITIEFKDHCGKLVHWRGSDFSVKARYFDRAHIHVSEVSLSNFDKRRISLVLILISKV